MAGVIGLLAVFNYTVQRRLRNPLSVTDRELFIQLLADVAALTALLYFSGGSSNPFVSLYLLPLIVTAIVLPRLCAGLMAVITAACYTLLMFENVPLPAHHDLFNLHLLGMWFNFMLSVVLIFFFVVRMAAALHEREYRLAAAREESLRNEQIVALGTLAAGAAHELGTPLSTMAVIAKEIEKEHAEQPALIADMRCLRDQIEVCKRTLTRLRAYAGEEGGARAERLSLEVFLNEMLEHWRLMRPAVPVTSQWTGPQPSPVIIAEQTLAQTLTNLINNAADASPGGVEISGRWDDRELALEIRDLGPGITPEVADRAGKTFVTTKSSGQGLGLGLLLANATVERLGGKVHLFNRAGGGACTQVTLPLSALAATAV